MGLNFFSNQVAEVWVKLGRTSSEPHQKKGFEPDTSAPVKTCLYLAERVSTVTPFPDWLTKPMRVCDLRRMNAPNYTSPTGTELQVHMGVCACAATESCIWTGADMSLSHLSSLFLLVCAVISLLWLQFFFPNLGSSASNSTIFFPSSSCFAGAIIWMTHSFPIT